MEEVLRQPPPASLLKLKLQLHGKRRHHIAWPQLTFQRRRGLVSNPPRQCDVSVSSEINWANVTGLAATSLMGYADPSTQTAVEMTR
jgi:hypothetical protein